jgi:hypothetical protein
MIDLESAGLYIVIALGVIYLIWYIIGAYLTRRRLAMASRWVYHGLDLYRHPTPERTRASIKWLSTNAVTITFEEPRPPFTEVVATVLLKSRDMVTIWFMDLLTRRRDLLVLRFDLERQPIWGVEVFRRRSIMVGDARRLASEAGWSVVATAEPNVLAAHGDGKAADLCQELLAVLGEEERRRLIRLSVRRQAPHLTYALDLPDFMRTDPADVMRLGERLAAIALAYST